MPLCLIRDGFEGKLSVMPGRCFVLLTLWAVLFCNSVSAGANGPNVVFIIADDLGWRDLACFGSTFYETPNIDRLTARGMKFASAYTAPVCSPTRASILTGKIGWPWRNSSRNWLRSIRRRHDSWGLRPASLHRKAI
jgi:hypothetical protein